MAVNKTGVNSGVSRAEHNRAIRKEALREQLSKQKHVEQVIENIERIEDLSGEQLDDLDIRRLSKAIDARLKLINKYLPDDKDPTDVNLGGQENNPLETKWTVEIVRSNVSKDS